MDVIDRQIGSEYSREFHRPATSAAVRDLDPACELVYNRRYELFQVIRWSLVASRLYVPALDGTLVVLQRTPFWECDVEKHHGLDDGDSPEKLIEEMKLADTAERPELLDDTARVRAVLDHRQKMEAKVREEWGHATRFNRRQVHRMWQPFLDYTGFVN